MKSYEGEPGIRRRHFLLWMGLLSIVAATCNVIADLILQYDPQGHYISTMNYNPDAFLDIATWRLVTGCFLGVFAIPLEIAGYWLVCTLLSETAPRLFRWLFWIIAYALVIGTVFHSTFLAIVLLGQAAHSATGTAQATLLQIQNTLWNFSVVLSLLFFVCYFATWLIIANQVLRHKTHLPKWTMLLAPPIITLLISIFYESHLVPVLGNILVPTVLSLPHLVFFTIITILCLRNSSIAVEKLV